MTPDAPLIPPHAEPAHVAPALPLLRVENLNVEYAVMGGIIRRTVARVHAIDSVSFDLARGETLGLVGESGSGKSTLGRAIVRLLRPASGTISLQGRDIATLGRKDLLPYRRRVQMVFQDPYSSLNPRMTAGEIVAEPMFVHGMLRGQALKDRVAELFDQVGLRRDRMSHFPSEFSGGQRQRICIARALALGPDLIVADEAVSALDVSVQAQILNLFRRLQAELGLSFLFISHDLGVIATVSHRIAVLYLGRVVELAPRKSLFATPLHPYTEALIRSVPVPDPQKARHFHPIGQIPSMTSKPAGCHFHTRCPLAEPVCREVAPELTELVTGHYVACHVRAQQAGIHASCALSSPSTV